MKKLLVMAAVVASAIAANAASFKWSATYIYSPTDTTQLLSSGTASLYCDAISSSALSTASIADGKIAATTFDDSSLSTKFEAGTKYDFYFTIEASGYTYKSNTKGQTANSTTTPTIGFGSQQSSTQGGGWVAVPEPTSGLLMLLGLAGLALKRKRA